MAIWAFEYEFLFRSLVQNNPDIKDWMKQQDPVIEDMPSLEQYFERKVLDLAKSAAKQYIIWQEIVDNGVQV